MTIRGQFGLEYTDLVEEGEFVKARRLNGFHIGVVKTCYTEKAYESILGGKYNEPEPGGRGTTGVWGFLLRYCTIDTWYREQAVKKGRIEAQEIDDWWLAWQNEATRELPLSDQDLLDHFRANRKERKKAVEADRRKRRTRRSKGFERKFQAERDPGTIFRRLTSTIPIRSTLDDQLLRSFSRMLAESNDLMWQAESLKDENGKIHEEHLQTYTKLMGLVQKNQTAVTTLLKTHGYDFQARRQRREAQTAAEVFEEFEADAEVLFDSRALEFVCPHCKISFGYLIRHFPTVEYVTNLLCPKCNQHVSWTLEALPDEVMENA